MQSPFSLFPLSVGCLVNNSWAQILLQNQHLTSLRACLWQQSCCCCRNLPFHPSTRAAPALQLHAGSHTYSKASLFFTKQMHRFPASSTWESPYTSLHLLPKPTQATNCAALYEELGLVPPPKTKKKRKKKEKKEKTSSTSVSLSIYN